MNQIKTQHYPNAHLTVEQFDAKHSLGEPALVTDIGRLLFADGASRDPEGPHMLRWEPNENDYERTMTIAFFWETKLKKAKQVFEDKRHEVMQQSHACGAAGIAPPDLAATKAMLLELTKRVRYCGSKLQEAEAAWEAAKPKGYHGSAEDLAREAEYKAQNDAFRKQIDEIRV